VSALRLVQDGIPATARVGRRIAATGFAAAGAKVRLGALRREAAPDQRVARARMLQELLARVTALHGVEVVVHGSPPAGAAIVAANHVSWLDPLVLGGLMPCVPISKDAVARWPVIGSMAAELGVLFVERGNGRSGMRVLRGAARALEAGIAVLNFPEGTTTRGEGVLPFHPGLLWMARTTGVPIVPVAISYDRPELAWVGDDTFLPHYVRLAGGARAVAEVRFGAPIDPCRFQVKADLACTVRAAVAALHGS
jgi:1-acyl-sn-glycerol-3-phosphate acyltransferase